MLSVCGIEADYDGESMPLDDAVERLTKHGIAGIVYTSPSLHRASALDGVFCVGFLEPLRPAIREKMLWSPERAVSCGAFSRQRVLPFRNPTISVL